MQTQIVMAAILLIMYILNNARAVVDFLCMLRAEGENYLL